MTTIEPRAIRFIATPIIAKDLCPGDHFSLLGPGHWSRIDQLRSIGELVYIRTNIPADEAPDAENLVYKITTEELL